MNGNAPRPGAGFGKRGNVRISPAATAAPTSSPTTSPNHLKWIGGGLAAVAVLGLIGGGTGGGGLLGGLIGGLLGKHLADRSAARSTPQVAGHTTQAPAPAAAAASTTVQRSGFGSTASSGTGGFFSSGS